jgi:hypothetical protein
MTKPLETPTVRYLRRIAATHVAGRRALNLHSCVVTGRTAGGSLW